MKNKQTQKNTLRLKLVPYLAFRAKMLEMDLQHLNEYVNELLETNPFMEEDRTAPAENSNWMKYVSGEEDMYSNLIHQFRMMETTEKEREIGEYMINSLTEEGYFTLSLPEMAKTFNIPVKTVESILKKIQMLDPPGIAARNLPECFILQLENEGPISPKIRHIISNHLEELAKEEYVKLSKKTGLRKETLKRLRYKISHLTAAPGFAFQKEKIKHVIPDLVIKRNGEELTVQLNKKFRRNFYINKKYLKIIKENSSNSKILKEMADKARWVKESIEERDSLLLRIGEFIAKNDNSFLKGNSSFPKKCGIPEISTWLNSDVSVVSRLVQNKYIETPVGTFPLHFFIQHKGRDFNDEEVKLKIKEIIRKEDKKKPLSDEEISKKLLEYGITIKRRTVVKYRKLLNIPSSSKRKITT